AEIRPLYRLIYQRKGSYDVGCKYSALREVTDLRKAVVTTSTAAAGSVAASSVTVVPAGDIVATNAQQAIEELDTEKVKVVGQSVDITGGTFDMTTDGVVTAGSFVADGGTPGVNFSGNAIITTDGDNISYLKGIINTVTDISTPAGFAVFQVEPLR
ncbi:unnamed protein product, partial [marine sediment metagenome]